MISKKGASLEMMLSALEVMAFGQSPPLGRSPKMACWAELESILDVNAAGSQDKPR